MFDSVVTSSWSGGADFDSLLCRGIFCSGNYSMICTAGCYCVSSSFVHLFSVLSSGVAPVLCTPQVRGDLRIPISGPDRLHPYRTLIYKSLVAVVEVKRKRKKKKKISNFINCHH